MRVVSLAAVLLTALLTSGCLVDLGHMGGRHHGAGHSGGHGHGKHQSGRGHGPPAHAPAHGYRHHQGADRVELSFDSGLGVYRVVGRSHHYFLDGHYLRVEGGRWLISTLVNGPWHAHAAHALTPGLRAKYGKSHPAKHRRHPEHPGKRGKSERKGWRH